jgi:hypothetical protein
MGDWIKLPSRRYLNLDQLVCADNERFYHRLEPGGVMPVDPRDREAILSALESRCRDEDGGLRG